MVQTSGQIWPQRCSSTSKTVLWLYNRVHVRIRKSQTAQIWCNSDDKCDIGVGFASLESACPTPRVIANSMSLKSFPAFDGQGKFVFASGPLKDISVATTTVGPIYANESVVRKFNLQVCDALQESGIFKQARDKSSSLTRPYSGRVEELFLRDSRYMAIDKRKIVK